MPRQQLSPATLKARQREKQAFDLRLAGATFADIADQLDYRWPSSAHHAVMRYLKRLGPPDEAKDMRKLQVQRLRRLLLAVWNRATRSPADDKAQQRALNILKEISALLGLYVPRELKADLTLIQKTPLEGMPIDELDKVMAAAEALAGLTEEDRRWLLSPAPDGGGESGAGEDEAAD